MLIEVLTSLGTPTGPFNAGTVYDVDETLGTEWVAKGFAKATTKPTTDHQVLLDRLDHGAGQPCLFLPSFGEFGHRIMTAIRIVHFHKACKKVVCCRPGEEVLYPAAHEFFTHWHDPTDDSARGGTGPAQRWPAIENLYPDHVPIQVGNLTRTQETLCIRPEERIPFRPTLRGLRADVCLGVRAREFCKEKNWMAWQPLAHAITQAGYTFAVIGRRPTTFDLAGQAYHSGDYPDTDAAIELLQNCRLFVGTDTGPSHLAATIGARMLVFRQEWKRNRDLRGPMADRNPGRTELMPDGTWKDPAGIIARTLELLA